MQQIDVETIGFIGQVGRNPDRKPLGVRRAGGAIGLQPGQLALAFNDLRVGRENVRKFAVEADADILISP
jgi:hypothetical protein